jgi:AcrR family transcriptional regulator
MNGTTHANADKPVVTGCADYAYSQSKMARPRAANYEEQKDAILSGAAELFARRGYLGTSMNDVADGCGLSKAALYHYYRDKDELLSSIAERHVTRLVELVRSVENDPSLLPRERLEALITRFLIEYADAQSSHQVLTQDVKYLPTAARERILRLERAVVDGFANAIAVQRPDVLEADLHKAVAMLLFGMLNWMFTWLRPEGRLSHATIAPLVRDLFLNGLTGLEKQTK